MAICSISIKASFTSAFIAQELVGTNCMFMAIVFFFTLININTCSYFVSFQAGFAAAISSISKRPGGTFTVITSDCIRTFGICITWVLFQALINIDTSIINNFETVFTIAAGPIATKTWHTMALIWCECIFTYSMSVTIIASPAFINVDTVLIRI